MKPTLGDEKPNKQIQTVEGTMTNRDELETIKYIDLFAGVGGFRYGIDRAFRPSRENKKTIKTATDSTNLAERNTRESAPMCVYSNEWDKYANSVYRKHYKECDDRDIRTVPSSDIPDHDLLVGGFPCQAFSIAGKRGGFEDTRGTLFFDVARILREKQPRLLLLENVKGLLSHDKGKTFTTIISTLDELGYDIQWQVLNSKDFGVPQNRERVFIVGHLRGTSRPEVFPITESNGATVKKLGNKNPSGNGQSGQVVSPEGLHPTIGAGGGNPNRKRDIGWSSGYIQQLNQSKQPHEVSNTVRSGGKGSITAKHAWDLVQDTQMAIRRLTPIECERLQGFPDRWTEFGADGEKISDTQRYKMMGNAVTTNVVSAIAERLCGVI